LRRGDLEDAVGAQHRRSIGRCQPLRKQQIPRDANGLRGTFDPRAVRCRREVIARQVHRRHEPHLDLALEPRRERQQHIGVGGERAAVRHAAGIAVTILHPKTKQQPIMLPLAVKRADDADQAKRDFERSEPRGDLGHRNLHE
jgi:hypothetical protein